MACDRVVPQHWAPCTPAPGGSGDSSTTALATDHPAVAAIYNNLGNVCDSEGDYDAAVECYGKALAIWLRALGADHPSTALTHRNVGNAYAEKGDADAAPPGRRRFKRDNVHEWAFGFVGVLGYVRSFASFAPLPMRLCGV